MEIDYSAIANYLYEAKHLNQIPRSWTQMMGVGAQSVAEHIHCMQHICFALAKMTGADLGKMLQMALFHDFAESRTGDLNYLNQKYAKADEGKVIDELAAGLPFGDSIKGLMMEYEARETLEAKLVKDADNIEFLLSMRELEDLGNPRATTWIPSIMQRFKTEAGKQIAEAIMYTKSDAWWFSEKDKKDDWWIHRNGAKNEKDVQ